MNIWQEIQPLQIELNTGLFGDDSLYAKTIRRTLSPEQAVRFESRSRERKVFRFRATVEWVCHPSRARAMGLRTVRRPPAICRAARDTKPRPPVARNLARVIIRYLMRCKRPGCPRRSSNSMTLTPVAAVEPAVRVKPGPWRRDSGPPGFLSKTTPKARRPPALSVSYRRCPCDEVLQATNRDRKPCLACDDLILMISMSLMLCHRSSLTLLLIRTGHFFAGSNGDVEAFAMVLELVFGMSDAQDNLGEQIPANLPTPALKSYAEAASGYRYGKDRAFDSLVRSLFRTRGDVRNRLERRLESQLRKLELKLHLTPVQISKESSLPVEVTSNGSWIVSIGRCENNGRLPGSSVRDLDAVNDLTRRLNWPNP